MLDGICHIQIYNQPPGLLTLNSILTFLVQNTCDMSRTTKHECPTSTPVLDAGKYQHLSQFYKQEFITIGLLAGLHGM